MIDQHILLAEKSPVSQRHLRVLHRLVLRVLCVFLLFNSTSVFAEDDVLKRARMNLDRGQAQLAYELLYPLQGEMAGQPAYDYLLGLTSLELNRPDETLFALERLEAVEPDYVGLHLLAARTYLILGDRETALKEFQLAEAAGNVSADAKDDFQLSLKNHDNRRRASDTLLSAYLELTLGYDNNVTSTTEENLISTPTGAILLDNDATDLEDVFGKLRAGVRFKHRLRNDLELVASGNAFARYNESVDDNDLSALDAQLGLRWRQGKTSITGSLYGQKFYRDHDNLRDAFGPLLQIRHTIDSNNTVLGFVRVTSLDYQVPQTGDRDSVRYLAGATYLHQFRGQYSPVGYVNVFGGSNQADSSSNDRFGYDLLGARVGGQLTVTPQLRPFASLSYSSKEHDANNTTFLTTREDDRYSIRLGAHYTPAKYWTIRPEVSYTNNDSNIILNDYDRTLWSLSIRRDFN